MFWRCCTIKFIFKFKTCSVPQPDRWVVAPPPSLASASSLVYPSQLLLEVVEKGPKRASKGHQVLLDVLDSYGGGVPIVRDVLRTGGRKATTGAVVALSYKGWWMWPYLEEASLGEENKASGTCDLTGGWGKHKKCSGTGGVMVGEYGRACVIKKLKCLSDSE